MKRGMSLAELIRQDVLDLHPEPPRPPCPIPPRLLILACSATKAMGDGADGAGPLPEAAVADPARGRPGRQQGVRLLPVGQVRPGRRPRPPAAL